MPSKVRALRMGSVYFRLWTAFFYKISVTQHQQQNTRVRAEGEDVIWAQVCSSLAYNLYSCDLMNVYGSNMLFTVSLGCLFSVSLSENFLFIFRAQSVKAFSTLSGKPALCPTVPAVCLFCCFSLIFLHLLRQYKA